MKLTIDNFDGGGARDYTRSVDGTRRPTVVRGLNSHSELRFSLIASGPDFVVPVSGARVMLGRSNGGDVFTGYLADPPQLEYLGWVETGPMYRFNLVAQSDEFLLDRKTVPNRPPFVDRSAGEALRQLTEEMLPGSLGTSGALATEEVAYFACNRQKKWSEHAATLALLARGSYRVAGGELEFRAIGETTHTIDEADERFSPEGLALERRGHEVNDVTVLGRMEPGAYVKDYFVGDGMSATFYLSQFPFTRSTRTLLEEEYATLEDTRWVKSDPQGAISVSGGKLRVAGGNGTDGGTLLKFIEKLELGGAAVLQHGDIDFSGASDGVVGGIYGASIGIGGCLAGFRVTASGSQSKIQALVSGGVTGASITTALGHRYVLSTRLYASEVYRRQQIFHSSNHPAGEGRGGNEIGADLRVVLEVRDIDPANAGSLMAPATVLHDGVLGNVAGYASYALINAKDMHCNVAFTRILRAVDAEVRSALPQGSYRTRLVGSGADGAECRISSEPALRFFPGSLPAANEQIVVTYRSGTRAAARVIDAESIEEHKSGSDDGVRGIVCEVQWPAPRSTADCENAALALMDDSRAAAWSGEYGCWSEFLPGGSADIVPGDKLRVNLSSQGVDFEATVRGVEIEVADLAGENSRYKISFADDAAKPLGFEFQPGSTAAGLGTEAVERSEVGTAIGDLTGAGVTSVSSTTVEINLGADPATGCGVEVRASDRGWGKDNDRNLLGRFSTRSFTVPRLARVQDYYLRQYDASVPARYSRHTTALHIEYPL